MKKAFILSLILVSFLSCKKEFNEIVKYDDDDNVVSKSYVDKTNFLDSIIYFQKGIIKSKIYFKKRNIRTYVKCYDSLGLASEGYKVKNIKVGKWKFYDSKNRMAKVVEFKKICNQEYANQEWNYDKKGKLNIERCNYFTYKFKNTVFNFGGTNELEITYIPMIKDKPICNLNFSFGINSDFCNVETIKKYGLNPYKSLTFKIPLRLDQKGETNFRGYIEENHYEDTSKKELVYHKSRKVYFDIPFNVK